MITGPNRQAAFIKGNDSTTEPDASPSALLYLFEEVSKLASPIRNSFKGTDLPSMSLDETSGQSPFLVKKEEEDAHSFQVFDSSCQHSLPRMSTYNQMKGVKEESSMVSLFGPHPDSNSPCKVLSLINLHCERLLHHIDLESDPSSVSSATKLAHLIDKVSTATADVTDQRVGCDCRSLEDVDVPLSNLPLTRDYNANLILTTETQCDTQLRPTSFALPSPQSASLSILSITQTSHSLLKQDDKVITSKPECIHAPIEGKSPPVAQLNCSRYNGETNPLPPAASKPESRSVQKEEIAHPSTQQWRTKTPRKQPHPSRSADLQDPDFKGVTFRMDTELDDSREQCRLLITFKYSKELCKSVRKPRWRTRTSQKSFKSSSLDEASDLDIGVSKGKVCASCCTRKTPMWRVAEDGTPLCNACGIRYKKYRVRCLNCWHIPRKEGNSNSCCLKCGNFVRLSSAEQKDTT